jgi:hypothetical protein
MSRIADLRAKLGLAAPEHEQEFRRLLDAIAAVDPALAQSEVVQVEILLRLHSAASVSRANGGLVKDLQEMIDDMARARVDSHLRDLIQTIAKTAANSIDHLEKAAERRLACSDPTARSMAYANTGLMMVLMILIGVAIGQHVRLPVSFPAFAVVFLISFGAVVQWTVRGVAGVVGTVLRD